MTSLLSLSPSHLSFICYLPSPPFSFFSCVSLLQRFCMSHLILLSFSLSLHPSPIIYNPQSFLVSFPCCILNLLSLNHSLTLSLLLFFSSLHPSSSLLCIVYSFSLIPGSWGLRERKVGERGMLQYWITFEEKNMKALRWRGELMKAM